MSLDKNAIKLYNRGRSAVALKTRDRSFLMPGATENYPSMEVVTLNELEYINANTPAVRNGTIEFDEDIRAEIYKALHISNWESGCVFEDDIDKMLLNANYDAMEKILGVTDLVTIDRIHGHMVRLISRGEDVGSRVQKIVDARRKELNEGVIHTRVQLVKKEIQQEPADIAKLVEQQVAAKLAEMTQAEPKPRKTASKTVKKKSE